MVLEAADPVQVMLTVVMDTIAMAPAAGTHRSVVTHTKVGF